MIKLIKYPLTASLLLTLVACGGGGSGNRLASTGSFVDDPVQGLSYSCQGGATPTSGFTNAAGEFSFYEGQTCSFKVGNVTLGPAVKVGSDSIITPQDVAGVSRNATDAPSSLAIAQFLQSLNDGTGTGKIVIPQEIHTKLAEVPAVSLVSSDVVVSQAKLTELITKVPGKVLVSPDAAKVQLVKQIDSGKVNVAKGSADTTRKLNSILVSSSVGENAAGLTETFTATAYYSDGTSEKLTDGVTWSSSKPEVVKLTGNEGKGLAVGSAVITASYTPGGLTTAISGSFEQKTTEATISNLVISFVKGVVASIASGAEESLQAIATFSDESTQTVSTLVKWVVTSATGSSGTAEISTTSDGATLKAGVAGVIDIISEYLGSTSKKLNVEITTPGFSGVAATGAPIANASVFLLDKDGKEPLGQSYAAGTPIAVTAADGSYTVSSAVMVGLQAPIIVRIEGKSTADNGDDLGVVFHAIADPNKTSTINATPLTEAQSALIASADPSAVFVSPSTTLSAYTEATSDAANQKLMTALGITAGSNMASANFISSPIDTTATTDISSVSTAKSLDLLMDNFAVIKTDGKLTFIDRNRPEDDYANGPKIVIDASASTASVPNGAVNNTPSNRLNGNKLQAFVDRVNTGLSSCIIDTTDTTQCDSLIAAVNNVFSGQFKHQGTPAFNWVKAWISDALDRTDLTGVTASIVTPYRGSFTTDDGTDVVRVLMKFSVGSDYVFRTMLLTDDGTNVVAYGNQKDYFVWMKPQMKYYADADNVYPFYPKYSSGLSLIVKHFYKGQSGVIAGAHFSGPGLPSARAATGDAGTTTEYLNRNVVTDGVEVMDTRYQGCSNLAVHPNVYIEKNTKLWSVAWRDQDYATTTRFKPANTSCDPTFDFIRRKSTEDAGFVLPKAGDQYTVTLYLNKTKVDTIAALAADRGLQTKDVWDHSGKKTTVYLKSVTYKLMADAFVLNRDLTPEDFPGITDETRIAVKNYTFGSDLDVAWTRSKVLWTEADSSKTPFVSFLAGRYVGSYDQHRTYDSYRKTSAPADVDLGGDSVNFREWARTKTGDSWSGDYSGANAANIARCNSTAFGTVKGGNVYFYNATKSSVCNASTLVGTDTVLPIRLRNGYASDKNFLVPANATSKKIVWTKILERERVDDLNLCSSFDGFIRNRSVYVNMIDINGRMLSESRNVYWDYENKTPYNYSGIAVSDRPNQATDEVYLENNPNIASYTGITEHTGQPGVIQPAKKLAADGSCVAHAF